MRHIDPKTISVSETHKYLLGGVSPRPIALISTISEDGKSNLAPFSFFNAFGVNPPIVAFSAAKKGRGGGLKDTYNNIMATKECVIQAVTYDMAEQVSLSSTEYDTGVNEFIKSGFTEEDSFIVKPKRVKESPFQMECKLKEMIDLGEGAGGGNLAICEVVYFHIAEDIFKDGIIYPAFIDLVGRSSGNFYTRVNKESLFEIEKPLHTKGIGYDNVPKFIRESNVFSANNLGKFGNSERIPEKEEVDSFIKSIEASEGTKETFLRYQTQKDHENMLKVLLFLAEQKSENIRHFFELTSKVALENNNSDFAWKTMLYSINVQ